MLAIMSEIKSKKENERKEKIFKVIFPRVLQCLSNEYGQLTI